MFFYSPHASFKRKIQNFYRFVIPRLEIFPRCKKEFFDHVTQKERKKKQKNVLFVSKRSISILFLDDNV